MKKFVLLFADITVLYGALALTLMVRYRDAFAQAWDTHFIPFSIIFILWLAVFYISNLYDTANLRNTVLFYSGLFRGMAAAGVISGLFFYLIPYFGITPRANLFLFIGIFTILQLGSRALFNRIIERRFRKHLLIVGVNAQALELARFIKDNPQLGYDLRFMVNLTAGRTDIVQNHKEEYNIVEGVADIGNLIRTEKIGVVVISPEAYQMKETIDAFYRSLEYRVNFYNLASFYEKTTGRVPLGAINQVWFLENITEETRKFYEMTKRGLDLVIALLAGFVFLILLPFIALAIKIDSFGPIFYRQKRLGRAGKIFEMIKLRTMHENAERASGAVWAQENDPRVTRLGRILRKTRLDELPQIWNVIRGNMSFVGPRAERPEFHEELQSRIPFYEERYLIKPGITGWAQINYRYGSSVKDAAEKLQYDLYYIKNRSLPLDLGIILKTINISLRQAGR